MNPEDYNLYDSIIFLTNKVGRLLSNGVHESSSLEEMSQIKAHMVVMVHLWQEDGLTQTQLTKLAIKDKTTITRAISTLEALNLVIRIPDESDKRTKKVYLTNKGKNMKGKLMPHAIATIEKASEGVSAADMATCKAVLKTMFKNLNQ